jgi:hypothetical protein
MSEVDGQQGQEYLLGDHNLADDFTIPIGDRLPMLQQPDDLSRPTLLSLGPPSFSHLTTNHFLHFATMPITQGTVVTNIGK